MPSPGRSLISSNWRKQKMDLMRSGAPLPTARTHTQRWFGLTAVTPLHTQGWWEGPREGRRVFAHPDPELISQGFAPRSNLGSSGSQEAFATSADAPAGPDALVGQCETPVGFGAGSTATDTQPHAAGTPALTCHRVRLCQKPPNLSPGGHRHRSQWAAKGTGTSPHSSPQGHQSPHTSPGRTAWCQASTPAVLFIPVYLKAPGEGQQHGTQGQQWPAVHGRVGNVPLTQGLQDTSAQGLFPGSPSPPGPDPAKHGRCSAGQTGW